MKTKPAAIGAIAFLLVIVGVVAIGFSGDDPVQVDCEEIYDQALEEEIGTDEIPDECEPVPEDVERQLLAGALG